MKEMYTLLFSVIFLCLMGCGSEFSGIELCLNERYPTVVNVSYTTKYPAATFVEFGEEGRFNHRTPVSDARMEHQHALLGMTAGSLVSARPVLIDAEGGEYFGPVQTIQLPSAPNSLPKFNLEVLSSQAEMKGRYLLTTVYNRGEGWVVVLNDQGEPVWYATPSEGEGVTGATIASDRSGILWMAGTVGIGVIEETSAILSALDGSSHRIYDVSYGHHTLTSNTGGEVIWLAYDEDTITIDGVEKMVYTDAVKSIGPGDGKSSTLFSFVDDYALDPYVACSHVSLPFNDGYEWTHTNSLTYDESEDAYFLLARYLDAVLKVSASDPQVIWQFGGVLNQFSGLEESEWFDHGHFSWIEDGKLLMFDNQTHSADAVSRVIEYALDFENMSAEATFIYTDPGGRYMHLLGDARPLPNGSILAVWSDAGEVEEVTRSKEVLWKISPVGVHTIGRAVVIDDLYLLSEPHIK